MSIAFICEGRDAFFCVLDQLAELSMGIFGHEFIGESHDSIEVAEIEFKVVDSVTILTYASISLALFLLAMITLAPYSTSAFAVS